MKKNLLSLISMMVIFCASLSAQITTSSIGGHVYGEDKHPLSGATVRATHTPTGTNYYTSALANGRFSISGMRVGGPYVIEITYLGYATEKRNNVQLSLGEEASFTFDLKEDVTQVGEIVVMGSNNPVFSPNRTGSEEIITSALMDKMPAINRSISDYTRLTPTSMSTGQGNSYGGVSGRFNNVTVDGASFNNSFGLSSSLGASGVEPISLEAIEQIQVMISPFDVRNGGFTGGGVNSVTKSGSNLWNGSAYTYIKSPKLEGLKQGDYTAARSDYTNKQYGFTLSGPIVKNKVFFFVNAELDRQETPVNWRPAKAGEAGDGKSISNISESFLKDVSDYLQSEFDYNPGSYNVTNRPVEGNRVTARLDWNISKKSTLSIKYFYLKSFSTSSPSTSGATGSSRGPNKDAIPFSSTYYRTNNNFNIFMADLDTKINDRMHNTLKVGYSAMRDFRDMDGGFFPQVDILNGSASGVTTTTFGTEANSYNNMLDTDIYQIQDYLSFTTNKHQITVGIQGDLRNFRNGFSQNYPGAWKFLTFDDFKYNVAAMAQHVAGGGTFANFNINNYPQTGYPAGTTGKPVQYIEAYPVEGDEFPFAYVDVMQLGAYIQDKWSVEPNFNLTYGVRFDMPIFLSDIEHNPKFDDVIFQYGQTINTSNLPATRIQISPRVGFNWDVFNDRNLQFRGGAGLFSGTPPYVWLSNQAGNNGMLFNSTSTVNTAGISNAGFTGKFNQNKPANASAAKGDIAVTDPDFKYPTIFKLSLAGDWRFYNDWIFTTEFLYSKSINDIYHQNINLSNVTAYVNDNNAASGSQLAQRPFFRTIPSGTSTTNYISSTANSVIKMSNTSEGYTAYTTFKLQRSFNRGAMKGLQVSGSFTFGKAQSVTDGSSSTAYSAWQYKPSLDPNSERLGYSLGSFNNRILITASYRKEYAKHFASSIGVVYDRYMPFRYSYAYSGDVNGDGSNANDLIYIPKNRSEILLMPYIKTGFTDMRTMDEMWRQLDAFISQDPYLSKHRGEYTTRNGGAAPMFNRIDLNFTQDFFFTNRDGQRNILRFSLDIRNFGNLLNKDWGVQKTTVLGNQQYQFLKMEQTPSAANNYTPGYSFVFGQLPSSATTSESKGVVPLTRTFQDFVSYQSRWGIQIGIKYMFN